MRKPRDYDAELKALGDKARALKSRKVQQLGELVIATGADTLTADELAGALIWMADKLRSDQGEHARSLWAAKGKQVFEDERKERKEETNTASEEAPHDEG